MTNREKIAEMKVADFFARYYYVKEPCYKSDFVSMLSKIIRCYRCPIKCKKYLHSCKAELNKWLDEEVSE